MPQQFKEKNYSRLCDSTPICSRLIWSKKWPPKVRTLLGSTDQKILDVVELAYRGQYEVAPSILPHRHQYQFITKLHEELSQCLVRAGLWSVTETALSLSRERRHLQPHFSSWTWSPSAAGRKKVAKQPRGESLSRSSWSHSSDHRSRAQQHCSWSPRHQWMSEALPQASTRPHVHALPSPSLPHPQCLDEQLHYSLSKLISPAPTMGIQEQRG